jgi:RNA polymerase sigma-70 factor (ECF subfamily)
MDDPAPPRSPDAAPTVEDLLGEVARGDERAFEQLYDRVAGPLFGLVHRNLRDRAQAEEIAQEVLVEVWRTARHYRSDRGSAMSWILTLAHRRAVDRVRSSQARRDREHRLGTEDYRRPFDEVTDAVAARFERREVRRCIATLTALQRESVVLAYYRGYTCEQAAQVLERPLGTVKTRLRDGLIRLRDCLGVGS